MKHANSFLLSGVLAAVSHGLGRTTKERVAPSGTP